MNNTEQNIIYVVILLSKQLNIKITTPPKAMDIKHKEENEYKKCFLLLRENRNIRRDHNAAEKRGMA